jgi:hypothetical protein
VNIDDVISRLQQVKRSGTGYMARCPAHEDKDPSLSVDSGTDGRVLINCHAGCSPDAIVRALGLELRDLFTDESGNGQGRGRRWTKDEADEELRRRGIRPETAQQFHVEVDIERQAWCYPLGRRRGKKYKAFPNGNGRAKYWVPQGQRQGVYHLGPCSNREHTWLVEGEPDVWIMHQAGMHAFTFTSGAGSVPRDAALEVAAAGIGLVHIVYDRDEAGRSGAQKAAEALRKAGVRCVVHELPPSVGKGGDVTTLYGNLGHDDVAFEDTLHALQEVTIPDTQEYESHRHHRHQRHLGASDAGANDVGDDGDDKNPTSAGARGPSQATRLVDLALATEMDLFHTPGNVPYATVSVDNHRQTHATRSTAFRRLLSHLFYQAEGKTPGGQAIADALGTLEGMAQFQGDEVPVHTRFAEYEDRIYVDLADEEWRVIEVTSEGWRVVSDAPVRFRRPRGMLSLPDPEPGGMISELGDFWNVERDDSPLLAGAIIQYARPRGPYPVLAVHGEQGSAKSTLARVVKAVLDPSEAAVRSEPREVRDLAIAAHNGWIVALDNVSWLPNWLSDAICRLATGGGFATRQLYSDDEEAIFTFQRPVILNGIEEIATRGDLLDRALVLHLPAIPEHQRRLESELWAAFTEAHPRLLGAVLDAVSTALRNRDRVHLDRMPRMADFAVWVTAAEPALGWEPGTFMKAYSGNREAANELALDASPVSMPIRSLVDRKPWTGTATELLKVLDALVGDAVTNRKSWPKTGRTLSNTISRLAPNLRAVGIEISRSRNGRARLITIKKTNNGSGNPDDVTRADAPATDETVEHAAGTPELVL